MIWRVRAGRKKPLSRAKANANSSEGDYSSDGNEKRWRAELARREPRTARRSQKRGLRPHLSAEMEQEQEELRAAALASMRSAWSSEA